MNGDRRVTEVAKEIRVSRARHAVVDAAIAEHRAQQTAGRLIISALTKPNLNWVNGPIVDATTAARSARQALREAVEQLLAAMGNGERRLVPPRHHPMPRLHVAKPTLVDRTRRPMNAPTLFDDLNSTHTPTHRTNDLDTSKSAGNIERATDRRRALALHQAHPGGLTDFELAELMGRQQTSAGKRRGELRDIGLVVDSGRRRLAPSGASAIVWQITAAGRDEVVA